MRKLPVYLVLDTSTSMGGEPIEAVKVGVQSLLTTLRQDPYALETAWLSVITFDSSATQLTPLTELASFQVPAISAKGSTSLGDALSLLSDCIGREVSMSSPDSKGDWKPLIFLMTDGAPTDDWQKGWDKLRSTRTGMIIACAAGLNADTKVLKSITDNVIQLATADENTIKAFFKWVSASISVGSQKVENGKKEVLGLAELPPPPAEIKLIL
ncbi:MAG: hypothetical protein RL748_2031 [Pseudomonadota bacterium]|jgi:uncharacterized protein YegL